MRNYDLSVLIEDNDPRDLEWIRIQNDYILRFELKELVYEIESVSVQIKNMFWLRDNIDNMWPDPIFQEMIGLQLTKDGITNSNEVANGISKTMTGFIDKIKSFFSKMMEYLRKVFQINTANAAKVLDALAVKMEDQNKRELAQKKYTSHGESTSTILQLLDKLMVQQTKYRDALNELNALKNPKETDDVEGKKEESATPNAELDKILEQLKTESGNGDDARNKDDGIDPINGGWFDPQNLKELSNKFKALDTMVGVMRDIQSRCNSISNDIKANTQMTKEVGKTKIDTIQNIIKGLEQQIRLIMTYSTKVGKKAQYILNTVK